MAKKKEQPTKAYADCVHESACRLCTDGLHISDASASRCPGHTTVKDSAAYLCGVLDERKRKQTNAERFSRTTRTAQRYSILTVALRLRKNALNKDYQSQIESFIESGKGGAESEKCVC